MPGKSGTQLPESASPSCTSVQWITAILPLKVLSSFQVPAKSAAEARAGASAAAAKYASFMCRTPNLLYRYRLPATNREAQIHILRRGGGSADYGARETQDK